MYNMNMRYKHDCSSCIPLGRKGRADLYFCGEFNGCHATVIARWGHRGPNYSSGLSAVDQIPELAEAEKRAIERGLLDPNYRKTKGWD